MVPQHRASSSSYLEKTADGHPSSSRRHRSRLRVLLLQYLGEGSLLLLGARLQLH
jgi:hypothetical protein